MEQRITAPNGCKIESVEHDDNSVVIMFSEDEEKQEMLDYMHSNGKDWDDVNMKVIPYIWKPKEGEKYWYIDRDLRVFDRVYYLNNDVDVSLVYSRNCFETRDIALKYAEELKQILKERKL